MSPNLRGYWRALQQDTPEDVEDALDRIEAAENARVEVAIDRLREEREEKGLNR